MKRYYGLNGYDTSFVNELHGVTQQKDMNPVNISCRCSVGYVPVSGTLVSQLTK